MALVGFIVFMERAQRRLLVQYPKRQVGNKMLRRRKLASAAEAQRLGRDPADFRVVDPADADDRSPASTRQNMPDWLQTIVTYISHGQPLYLVLYALLIIFFSFFYTSIIFNPEETAENLKKYGGVYSRHPARQEDRRSTSTIRSRASR